MKIKVNNLPLIAAQAGLSLTQLSQKAHVSRQTLHNISNGIPCGPLVAVKISQALGVPVEDLILREEA